jgi:hypothetical protein
MAEIALVQFARVALDVAQATVPRYRTKFSKHTFSLPQLLAILCLMRYEDWTYREAEVRLAEPSELRRALQLASVPDHTALYRFLRRLDEASIDRALHEVVQRIPLPGPRRRARVAIDATGLSQGAISTFFVRRMHHHTQQPMPWRKWLKWLVVVDLDRRLILAQKAHAGPTNDGATLLPLLDIAHRVRPIGLVLADAEFDSELNHTHISPTAPCPQRYPGQAWKTDLANQRRARPDAKQLSPPPLLPTGTDRNHLLHHQTQTLRPSSWPVFAHPAATSPAARACRQPLPSLARAPVL